MKRRDGGWLSREDDATLRGIVREIERRRDAAESDAADAAAGVLRGLPAGGPGSCAVIAALDRGLLERVVIRLLAERVHGDCECEEGSQ